MLETFVEFTFEAAHQIPPYSGMHGHSFKVVVYLNGKPDPVFGWTHNLYDVEAAMTATKNQLDHSYLNEIEGLEVPSLENVAYWIWHRLDKSSAWVGSRTWYGAAWTVPARAAATGAVSSGMQPDVDHPSVASVQTCKRGVGLRSQQVRALRDADGCRCQVGRAA